MPVLAERRRARADFEDIKNMVFFTHSFSMTVQLFGPPINNSEQKIPFKFNVFFKTKELNAFS
jgi:hypothetical protein